MLQTAKPIKRGTKAPAFLDPASITTRYYGMILSGECLHPAFKNGEQVIFDREAAVEAGCFACFYYRSEVVPAGRLGAGLKRVVIAPPDWVKFPWRDNPKSEVVPVIIVEQFNPPRQWSIRCSDLLAVHCCIGSAADPEVVSKLEAEGWKL